MPLTALDDRVCAENLAYRRAQPLLWNSTRSCLRRRTTGTTSPVGNPQRYACCRAFLLPCPWLLRPVSPAVEMQPRVAAVRFTFALVAALFPIQYLIAKRLAEPYPAIMMPGFEGARTDSSGAYVLGKADVVVTFRDGTQDSVSLRTAFAGAPSSQFWTVAEGILRPRLAPAAPSPGRRRSLARLLPGYQQFKDHRWYWAGIAPETSLWLEHRLMELFPGRVPVSATVRWFKETVRPSGGNFARQEVLADKLVVRW